MGEPHHHGDLWGRIRECSEDHRPAAPHPSDSERPFDNAANERPLSKPSDSERTPRTADEYLNEEYAFVEPKFAAAFRAGWTAREAESEPAGLDVERLTWAISPPNHGHTGPCGRPCAVAILARLSPSTGKGLPDTAKGKLPEQPNQDAGGIPYWPQEGEK